MTPDDKITDDIAVQSTMALVMLLVHQDNIHHDEKSRDGSCCLDFLIWIGASFRDFPKLQKK